MSVELVGTSKNWRYRLPLNFFGLNDEYIESVYEQIFQLKHHGGWSFIEAYNLPIQIRHWFLNRLVKHYEDQNKEIENAKKKSR